MTNIDFIKWCFDKARWLINGENVLLPDNKSLHFEEITGYCYAWNECYYPLLLQRAIEGVNNDKAVNYIFVQSFRTLRIVDNEYELVKDFSLYSDEDFDYNQAKELALRYIWKLEKRIKLLENNCD